MYQGHPPSLFPPLSVSLPSLGQHDDGAHEVDEEEEDASRTRATTPPLSPPSLPLSLSNNKNNEL